MHNRYELLSEAYDPINTAVAEITNELCSTSDFMNFLRTVKRTYYYEVGFIRFGVDKFMRAQSKELKSAYLWAREAGKAAELFRETNSDVYMDRYHLYRTNSNRYFRLYRNKLERDLNKDNPGIPADF